MNVIEAMQAELEDQIQCLQKQALLPLDKNPLFVGSGDSYVAGLVAQNVSNKRAICCHPADIIQNPSISSGRNVYIVSISGSTKASILAARVAIRKGARTTAITARPASRLGRTCDETIELKYKSAGVTTPGTISFTSSLLACTSLAAKIRLPADLGSIYRQAENQARNVVKKIHNNKYFLLGDGILYPVAVYGALKFNEIFGARAIPYPAEEFCHSPLFSLKKDDQIILMGRGERLDQRLKREGYSSVQVDFRGTGIRLILQSVFFIQLLMLYLAQRRGLTSCYFLSNKKLLKISSDFIYG